MKRRTFVAGKIVATGILAFMLVACGAANENSETKVTNGKVIGDSSYPSVVQIYAAVEGKPGTCTGTFVSKTKMITAGHCVESLDSSDPKLYVLGKRVENGEEKYFAKVKAVSFKRHPKYDISLGVSRYDVTIVTFPADSASGFSTPASKSPSVGQKLTIVGYGANVLTGVPGGRVNGS
ncbi:MAG TPA: trypsin-like serine protease, partial [Oligoflexus sp.]|uniref:trypsin-like serine protease n=1 Tax=Oligoflexus sp. TaxID=1971216 RepID=UPI002D5BA8C9